MTSKGCQDRHVITSLKLSLTRNSKTLASSATTTSHSSDSTRMCSSTSTSGQYVYTQRISYPGPPSPQATFQASTVASWLTRQPHYTNIYSLTFIGNIQDEVHQFLTDYHNHVICTMGVHVFNIDWDWNYNTLNSISYRFSTCSRST